MLDNFGIATAGGTMNWQRVFINYSIRISFILSLIFSYYSSLLSNPEGDGKISGFIFNASHQPLANVEVRAVADIGTYFYRMTYSQNDGSYFIDSLPVGQYYVRVQNKLGYLNVYYDNDNKYQYKSKNYYRN